MKFKPGMTVIHGYEQAVITKMSGSTVKEVRIGWFLVSGFELLVFEATPENLDLAASVRSLYMSLHDEKGTTGLNWPMIKAYMEQRCAHVMSGLISKEEALKSLTDLKDDILAVIKAKARAGFQIFR